MLRGDQIFYDHDRKTTKYYLFNPVELPLDILGQYLLNNGKQADIGKYLLSFTHH